VKIWLTSKIWHDIIEKLTAGIGCNADKKPEAEKHEIYFIK